MYPINSLKLSNLYLNIGSGNKFKILTENIISRKESDRFLKDVQNLKKLKNNQLTKLNIEVSRRYLKSNNKKGIF